MLASRRASAEGLGVLEIEFASGSGSSDGAPWGRRSSMIGPRRRWLRGFPHAGRSRWGRGEEGKRFGDDGGGRGTLRGARHRPRGWGGGRCAPRLRLGEVGTAGAGFGLWSGS